MRADTCQELNDRRPIKQEHLCMSVCLSLCISISIYLSITLVLCLSSALCVCMFLNFWISKHQYILIIYSACLSLFLSDSMIVCLSVHNFCSTVSSAISVFCDLFIFLLTQSLSKTPITRSVHCKFNSFTVAFTRTRQSIYIIYNVLVLTFGDSG